MSSLYCPECAGEFADASALNRHLRFEESYSAEDAFETVGNEIASAKRRAAAPRVDLEGEMRRAGFRDTAERDERAMWGLKRGQYLR